MSQRKDASLFSAGASRRSRVSPLAVETRHLRLGVTRTGGGVLIGAVLLAIWFGRGARRQGGGLSGEAEPAPVQRQQQARRQRRRHLAILNKAKGDGI